MILSVSAFILRHLRIVSLLNSSHPAVLVGVLAVQSSCFGGSFMTNDSPVLPRVLGPFTALCVVVGSVIGSGIFLVPATVARDVPFLGGIILVWVIGGLFSAAGALTLAELGATLPQAGGPYVYLRAAYGRLPAFLFGWTEFLILRAGLDGDSRPRLARNTSAQLAGAESAGGPARALADGGGGRGDQWLLFRR